MADPHNKHPLGKADRDLLRRLDHAADCMEPFDRLVFLCARVDGLSGRQIAEIHRVDMKEVEAAMVRALRVLADKMRADYVPPRRRWWQFWKWRP